MTHFIIPDIHGQADKLNGLLAHLGWRRTTAGFRAPAPADRIVFLGDFIDRGPDNAAVLATVRALSDSGKADAIMGNHELNAFHFHTSHPETGKPLRAHSEKNLRQHGSFLAEFPVGGADTRSAIDWMGALPLFRDYDDFRIVHACWRDDAVAALRGASAGGALSPEQLIAAADPASDLFSAVEVTAKGPETDLPDGFRFHDKDGTERRQVRLKWWQSGAGRWRDSALSVPDLNVLPDAPLPAEIMSKTYKAEEKPVFFGHYWLTGAPVLQAPNALCLDYSAGKDGPLLAYRYEAGAPLSVRHIEQAA